MPSTPSRRAVVVGSAAVAAAAGIARGGLAAAAGDGATRPLSVPADPVLNALRRLTYGPTPELVTHVREIGLRAWVRAQLSGDGSVDPRAEALAATLPTTHLPAAALAAMENAQAPGAVQDLRAATLIRAIWGERQLSELLVELWSNHFSIHAEIAGADKVVDDREVIRPHALGTFRELLSASARSPAMLTYLDNATSRGSRPNENYARELLELHTLGVDAGYSSRDVRNAALVFTGWTVDPRTRLFAYRSDWHHVGPVRVLGWASANHDPEAGVAVGQSLLDYLATHHATSRTVATKLVRRLVDDKPPAALVSSTAAVLRRNDMAIVPAVQHVIASREFSRSGGRKTQRPLEWFTASVRALGLEHDPAGDGGAGLVSAVRQLGQLPFGWPAPDGYPDEAQAWTSSAVMLSRWNIAQALVAGRISGLRPLDPDAFLGSPVPATAGALVDRVTSQLLGVRPSSGLRAPLLRYLRAGATAPMSAEAVRAATPQLAALVLSSPDAQVR